MPRLIRSAVLTNYVEVAKAVGLDPYGMAAEFRLPPVSLTDPEVKVSAAAVGRLHCRFLSHTRRSFRDSRIRAIAVPPFRPVLDAGGTHTVP